MFSKIIPIKTIPIPKNQRLISSKTTIANNTNKILNINESFIILFFNRLTPV